VGPFLQQIVADLISIARASPVVIAGEASFFFFFFFFPFTACSARRRFWRSIDFVPARLNASVGTVLLGRIAFVLNGEGTTPSGSFRGRLRRDPLGRLGLRGQPDR